MMDSKLKIRERILFRRPVFSAFLLLALCVIVVGSGPSLFISLIGISYAIKPTGVFSDLAHYDTKSVIEAIKIILQYILQGGSFFDAKFSQSSWLSSLTLSGSLILACILSILSILFGHGRLVLIALMIGCLTIICIGIYLLGALIFKVGLLSYLSLLYLTVITAYISFGGYGLNIMSRELNYMRQGGVPAAKTPLIFDKKRIIIKTGIIAFVFLLAILLSVLWWYATQN